MARTRRAWVSLKAELYRMVVEALPSSYWSERTALDLWNQCKDEREMELMEAHEGFRVVRHGANLVADEAEYAIPEGGARLKRIVRVFEDGTERPLDRDERFSERLSASTAGQGMFYLPTYRLRGDTIVLEPTPEFAEGDAVNDKPALVIELEEASERFADDDSVLPSDWPIYAETLLLLDTVMAMFDVEGAQSQVDEGAARGFEIRRGRYSGKWREHIETRSFGRVYVAPFTMLD